jgi:2-methylisocitrate lyase-like PEP mutase family enzyme
MYHKILKKLIYSNKTLIMPDTHDPISARTIERSGFKAVQCSGYSISIAAARTIELIFQEQKNIQITL